MRPEGQAARSSPPYDLVFNAIGADPDPGRADRAAGRAAVPGDLQGACVQRPGGDPAHLPAHADPWRCWPACADVTAPREDPAPDAPRIPRRAAASRPTRSRRLDWTGRSWSGRSALHGRPGPGPGWTRAVRAGAGRSSRPAGTFYADRLFDDYRSAGQLQRLAQVPRDLRGSAALSLPSGGVRSLAGASRDRGDDSAAGATDRGVALLGGHGRRDRRSKRTMAAIDRRSAGGWTWTIAASTSRSCRTGRCWCSKPMRPCWSIRRRTTARWPPKTPLCETFLRRSRR